MTDPVPSKECDCCKDGFFPFCPCGCHQRAAAQRVAAAVSMEQQVEHLRRENVRWENARNVWMAEEKRLNGQVARLKQYICVTALAGYRCAACATRLTAQPSKPAHEREPPHCSSCSCGMDPPQPEAIRALWNKAVIVQDGNRATVAFETAEEAETAFDYIHDLGSMPAPEPADGKRIDLPIATWAQALDIIGQCAEIDAMDDHAKAWIREANKFFDSHAVSLTESAQPPGDGQA